ncbi:branchpoint-bridging protein-like [Panonychus citri]|uniref:branchpoint-bridging protein-like n=1 Tax=Panonychus citri TaxID=50023 RepID=UPI002308276D|nr:branchpoint-bridging protein-like [Panonychus citri]XP_053207455.1 branchpoint-bridging protein-like [Panonychus citri]
MIDNNSKSSSGSFSEHLSSITNNKNNNSSDINHHDHDQFTFNNVSCSSTINCNNQNLPTTTLLELHKGRPIKITIKVIVPVKDHPNYNFIGKLLGPKGNSLKWLQEETQTKMAILGKGSMRDKKKEEELTSSGNPKYLHLKEDLHVEISTFAPPAEAYTRMGHALNQVQRFLVPDYYDDIRQQQLRELGVLNVTRSGSKGENEIDSMTTGHHHLYHHHHVHGDKLMVNDDDQIFDESNGSIGTSKSNGLCSNTQTQPTPNSPTATTTPSTIGSNNLNNHSHAHHNLYHLPHHPYRHHHLSCTDMSPHHFHNHHPSHSQHPPYLHLYPHHHHAGFQTKCSHCPIAKTIISSTSPTLSSSSTSSSITALTTGGGGKTKSSSSSSETSPLINNDYDLITKDCSCPHVELENSDETWNPKRTHCKVNRNNQCRQSNLPYITKRNFNRC